MSIRCWYLPHQALPQDRVTSVCRLSLLLDQDMSECVSEKPGTCREEETVQKKVKQGDGFSRL